MICREDPPEPSYAIPELDLAGTVDDAKPDESRESAARYADVND